MLGAFYLFIIYFIHTYSRNFRIFMYNQSNIRNNPFHVSLTIAPKASDSI